MSGSNYKVGLWNVLHSMGRQLMQKSQLCPERLVSIFIDQRPAYTDWQLKLSVFELTLGVTRIYQFLDSRLSFIFILIHFAGVQSPFTLILFQLRHWNALQLTNYCVLQWRAEPWFALSSFRPFTFVSFWLTERAKKRLVDNSALTE